MNKDQIARTLEWIKKFRAALAAMEIMNLHKGTVLQVAEYQGLKCMLQDLEDQLKDNSH
jgi:hypothetical protein